MSIQLQHLTRLYRMGSEEVAALKDLSLTVRPGEFLAILGPSGSGKTTLLHLIGGLDRPSSGEIRVGDFSLQSASSDSLAEYRRAQIGVVFQSYHLIGHLTALENVEQSMALSGVPAAERRRRAEQLLASVGMGDRMRHRPSQLSGGQQQRVSIARALANDPEILLCDEPTGNLDSASGQQVMDLLRELNRTEGRTLILITHNADLVHEADRVLELRDGNMVELRGEPPAGDATEHPPRRTGTFAWRDVFGYARRNLARVKARAILTGLGVAIGVGAIVLMVSFGQGLQNAVLGQLNGIASLTQIQVTSTKSSSGFSFSVQSPTAGKPINDTTLRKLAALPHVTGAWYSVTLLGQASIGKRSALLLASSLSPRRFILSSFSSHIEAGRLPGTRQDAIVLADQSARLLVPEGKKATTSQLAALIGKTVTASFTNDVGGTTGVGGAAFQRPIVRHLVITGIMQGSSSYTPYALLGPVLKAGRGSAAIGPNAFLYDTAVVQVDHQSNVQAVARSISRLGYGTQTFADFIKSLSQVFLIIESILGVIGGIALVVAGLGIANVMVVAVLERTREIGVLKALGARRRDIRRLFLAESLMIGLGGGLVGLIGGYAGGVGINLIVDAVIRQQGGQGVHLFAVTWQVAVGAVLFALFAALVSGIYPANKAAGLNPISALRYD